MGRFRNIDGLVRWGIFASAVGLFLLLILLPLVSLNQYAVREGIAVFWDRLKAPEALYALRLTAVIALAATAREAAVSSAGGRTSAGRSPAAAQRVTGCSCVTGSVMPPPGARFSRTPLSPATISIPAWTLNELQTLTSASPDAGVALSVLSIANVNGYVWPGRWRS